MQQMLPSSHLSRDKPVAHKGVVQKYVDKKNMQMLLEIEVGIVLHFSYWQQIPRKDQNQQLIDHFIKPV